MFPKPVHLGPEYSAQFGDRSVVAAYRYRPPYPEETFDILEELIVDRPRVVLDAGCGTGNVARPLARRVERVDAVDLSRPMIEVGRSLPDGHAPNLRWIVGRAEDAELYGPYALITAGSSLHWMDWAVVMPRFAELLSEHGVLAIFGDGVMPVPWNTQPICARYSTNRDYAPYDLLQELTMRGLFQQLGSRTTRPVPFRQSVDRYIESFHARNGLSRDRMTPSAAAAFDAELRAAVEPHARDGHVELQLVTTIVWGKPVVGTMNDER